MAKLDYKLPEDFLLKVSRLADKTDVLLPKVLLSGAEVVLAKVKKNLSVVIGKNTKTPSRSSGELEASLGVSPAKIDRNGVYNVKIGFAEPRSDGGSNAKIANILEYGKSGQSPKPFLKPAKTQSKDDCIKAMLSSLKKEMEKL